MLPGQAEALEKAAKILQEGGLVAFPTETVYGLGANGLSGDACKKIYEAKGRPSDNPLILHIADLAQLPQIVCQVPPKAKQLMEAFWPGPMTLILPKTALVPDTVTGGLTTVGVRFPSHPVAQALIRAANLPIAAPSANLSGRPSPTEAAHVLHDLNGKIPLILDGGPCEVGLESTIIDATGPEAVILRPGAITKEMIEALLGRAEVDPAVMGQMAPGMTPRAPGMKYTHYAPKANVTVVRGSREKVIDTINARTACDRACGKKVAVLATEENRQNYQADNVFSLGRQEDLCQVGASLFLLLRRCDEVGADQVYAEGFLEQGEGLAIMNRLRKAAGGYRADLAHCGAGVTAGATGRNCSGQSGIS